MDEVSHSKSYKNSGKNIADLRRRRNEVAVELRKSKRDEVLMKKRNNVENVDNVDDSGNDELDFSVFVLDQNMNMEEKISVVKMARKLLSSDKNPPIDKIIDAGILPLLIYALQQDEYPKFQLEAAWAITNIASGTSEQTIKVYQSGAVPYLIKLLFSPHENVAEQSLWALGNIIGDGPFLRNYVLSCGFLEPLIQLTQSNCSISFLRNITWVIVNICRIKNPPAPLEVYTQLIPLIQHFLKHSQDNQIIVDNVWALFYITDQGKSMINIVIESDIVRHVIPLLLNQDSKIQTPALRVVGNIATGSDDQTQVILDQNVLSFIPQLLNSDKERIKKETLWLISNITAGRTDQIQSLIDSKIILMVIDYLKNGSFFTQKEAAWVISNMTMNGTSEQIRYLVDSMVIEPMCNLLSVDDTQTVHILLEALIKIFEEYKDNKQMIAIAIENCGGLDRIEALQAHENNEIYKAAYDLIDKYIDTNDDGVPDLVPQQNENQYQFPTSTSEQQQQQPNFQF